MDYAQLSLWFVLLLFATYALVQAVMWFGLRLSLGAAAGLALAQIAWLALTGVLAGTGYLVADVTLMPPTFVRVVVLPGLALTCLLAFSPGMGRRLDGASADWLISAQAFRLPLEFLLYGLAAVGEISERLTFAGSNFDVLTGVAALLLGYLVHKRKAPRWSILVFNLMGLCLLVTIVTMALLSAPTPVQVFHDGPDFRLPFHVPFVWLPGYLVPVALLLHLLSLRKLWRERAMASAQP